jgi:hypothetical protein
MHAALVFEALVDIRARDAEDDLVAAGISTLSTPIPARPTTFKLVAASRIALVTLVAERIARPS